MKFNARIEMKTDKFFSLEYIFNRQIYTLEIAIFEKNKHWKIGEMVSINLELF